MRGVCVVGLVLLAVASAGVAAANQPPMAEAGLDQNAVVNQTVYLDAGGSLDPDGRIVEYRWSIETPGGNTTTPDCVSCSLTYFVPRENGTYAVTVTVTDDQGASMSDRLYVRVSSSMEQNGSPSTRGNSQNSVPAPTVGVGGSGGGGGGGMPQLSSIQRTDSGTYVLRGRGWASNTGFEMEIGGKTVRISAKHMSQMAADDGQVTLDEASRFVDETGLTEKDIYDALQGRSGANCGGNRCTYQVDKTSGERSENKDLSEEEKKEWMEKLGCTGTSCSDGGGDSNDGSETATSDSGSNSDSDSLADEFDIGNPFGGGGDGGAGGNDGGDGADDGSVGGGIDIGPIDIGF